MSFRIAALPMVLVAIGLSATAAGATTPKPPPAVTRALLRKSDLPAGWIKDSPGKGDSASDEGPTAASLATCLKLPAALIRHNSPEAKIQWDSLTPAKAGGSPTSAIATFANSITVGNAGDAKVFAALSSPGTAGCVSQLVTSAIQKEGSSSGLTVASVNTTAFDPGPYVLDHAMGFRVAATVNGTGPSGPVSAPFSLDLVFARRGRYIAAFEYGDVGAPLDPAIEQRALTAVSARIAKLP